MHRARSPPSQAISRRNHSEALFSVGSDLEKNEMEEDVVDFRIYSTLTLSKLRPVELDVERAKTLIWGGGEDDQGLRYWGLQG